MASTEEILKELRHRAFEQNLYWNVKFPASPKIQQLVAEVLGRQLDPILDAALRVFLEFVNKLEGLFRRESELSGMILALEAQLEFMEDDPEEAKQEIHEELECLGYQMRRLEPELVNMQQHCNALRGNPQF